MSEAPAAQPGDHYDVLVIGSGPAGGTVAGRVAETGKRVLLIERGDWLPRELENWDSEQVFAKGRYTAKETFFDLHDKPFTPEMHAFVGGNFVTSGEAGIVERIIETAQSGISLRASAAYQTASARLSGPPQFVYYNSNTDYLHGPGRVLKGGEREFKPEGQRANLQPSFAFGLAQADGFYVESRTPLGTFPRLLTAVTSKLGENGATKEGGE